LINQMSVQKKQAQAAKGTWDRIVGAYASLLHRCLRYRFEVISIVCLVSIGVLWANNKYVSEGRHENSSRFNFQIKFDEAIKLHERDEFARHIESYLETNRDKFDVKQIRMEIYQHSCCAYFRVSRHVEQDLT